MSKMIRNRCPWALKAIFLFSPLYLTLQATLHVEQSHSSQSLDSPLARHTPDFARPSTTRYNASATERLQLRGGNIHLNSGSATTYQHRAPSNNIDSTTGKSSNISIDPWIYLPSAFDPSLHNQTAVLDAQRQNHVPTIPGLFWENRLWLLGVRLTTSYEPEDQRVFLTIFGMPGDFYKRKKSKKIRCPANEWYNGSNGTLLGYSEAKMTARLFASLPGQHDNKSLFPMEFLSTVSADANQNNNTIVWHGDLHEMGITKATLKEHFDSHQETALRLQVHARHVEPWTTPTPILLVDIPLSTGVVGQAGPQMIQPETSSLLGDSSQPIDAAVCVAVYGGDTLKFLPEFVYHHINLGFGQVMVGIVDGLIGSPELELAYTMLKDFVDQGQVSITAMGLPKDMLQCEVNVRKQHFYNACLYHAKGLTPYVGIWDVDEFWVPVTKNTTYNLVGPPTTRSRHAPRHVSPEDKTRWLESNYAASLSIGATMAGVEGYQEWAGCGEAWCYHSFPAYTTFLRHKLNGTRKLGWDSDFSPRTGVIAEDFHLRESDIDWDWSKSITRTKYAYMGGLHQVGSCRFPHTPAGKFLKRSTVEWYDKPYTGPTKSHQECRNLVLEGFGMVHHYFSLNRVRSSEWTDFSQLCKIDPKTKQSVGCEVDEYVERFGKTVDEQLANRESKRNPNL